MRDSTLLDMVSPIRKVDARARTYSIAASNSKRNANTRSSYPCLSVDLFLIFSTSESQIAFLQFIFQKFVHGKRHCLTWSVIHIFLVSFACFPRIE